MPESPHTKPTLNATSEVGRRPRDLDIVLDYLPVCVILKDARNNIIRVNRRLADLVGVTPQDMAGTPTAKWFPEQANEFLESDQQVIRSGKPQRGVVRQLIFRGHDVRWLLIDKFPYHNESGAITGVIVFTQDITPQKHAFQQLAESRAVQSSLVDALPVCVYRIDTHGRLTFCNHAYSVAMGRTPEELLGRTAFDFYPEDMARAYAETDRQIIATGKVIERIEANLSSDGQAIKVHVIKSPIRDDNGEIIGVQGVYWDVTREMRAQEEIRALNEQLEQRVAERTAQARRNEALAQARLEEQRKTAMALSESEARFRLAFDEGPFGMALFEREGRLLRANAAFCRLLGYDEREISSKSLSDITHPDDLAEHARLTQRLIDGLVPRFNLEERYLARNGTPVWVRVTCTAIRDHAGTFHYGVTLVENLTDRRKAEAEMERHREHLAHAQRLAILGELAAGLAHEINQPLGAIRNYAQACLNALAADTIDVCRLAEPLDEIVAEAVRASEAINRLRRFIRKDRPHRSIVDLNNLARHAVMLSQPQARELSASIALKLADGLPVVRVDLIQIEQVILNLLRNSLEAAAELPPQRRRITLRTCEKPENVVELEVADDGPGLKSAHCEQVFQPFYTTKPAGLGLGLALSRSLIEAHGGHLWAEPGTGSGACFRFTLQAATRPT